MPWSVAFMVIMIVMITAIARTSKEKYRAQAQTGLSPADGAEAARLREDVQKLRERVQVLERVITDERKSIDLTQEIERLRDR
jgi:uncharacterized protein YlxW (UPF0749 family)